jgi:hypothetical protein
MQDLMKKLWGKVRVVKTRGVEFWVHTIGKAAIE